MACDAVGNVYISDNEDRIRKVTKHVSPDKVTLSSDCGMKPLARMVAKMKLNALVEGANIVRTEIAG